MEKWGWPQVWLREFQAYLHDPRLTFEEFWVCYTLKRMAAQDQIRAVMTKEDAMRFYTQSDYLLWRNLVHRRHSAWRRVLVTMRGREGHFLEFGCGTAPVATWVKKRKPGWQIEIEDVIGSPHFDFARWRFGRGRVMGWDGGFQVITALDVFEHLDDPLLEAKRLVGRLAPGGYLHWNFVAGGGRSDLDLATPTARRATLSFLAETLNPVWSAHGYTVSQKARP